MSSAPRGLAPCEGLGCVLMKMGRAGPPFEPRHRPHAGKSGDPRSQNADIAEMITPIFLRMRLTDMLKMNPYAKYMKDIVTNKRKIPEAEISTMLANYIYF